jgi:hypothetical protein
MGSEARCNVRFGKQQSEGQVLLETNEILFRGAFRLKIPLATIKSVKAVSGALRVYTPEGLVVFELGAAAEKWCDKILHPKPRLEKLGVKSGARVSLVGNFDADFLQELGARTDALTKNKVGPDSEWILLAADSQKELSAVAKLAKTMRGASALWIVYPKGQKDITEDDVLFAGRQAGLKDVKVVGFSPKRTALKFVIPLSLR